MQGLLLPSLIVVRLLFNEGMFLEQRRMPLPRRSGELNHAIRRPWRRGCSPAPGCAMTDAGPGMGPASSHLKLERVALFPVKAVSV
ncbi:MAG: hypothetical protein CBB79_01550 [Synechococcus sp. TMED19]|nr:MAG: hypothetical protein CBB79_01550 [Synechococcus sp. TMED19]